MVAGANNVANTADNLQVLKITMRLSEQPFSQGSKADQPTASTQPQTPTKLYLNYRHREAPKVPTPAELSETASAICRSQEPILNKIREMMEQEEIDFLAITHYLDRSSSS